jgi:hypothetical protein
VNARACFADAAAGFVAVVAGIPDSAWSLRALDQWTVRDLVGHTSRALSTVETYLVDPSEAASVEVVIREPLDYLVALRGPSVDSQLIAQRGRDAGVALGDDPAVAVRELAERVTALVAATPDDAVVRSAMGGATLIAYLPTRTFELTVHSLDLLQALGAEPPPILAGPMAACLQLAAAAAGRGVDHGAAVLLALTGRRGLPEGFSVV